MKKFIVSLVAVLFVVSAVLAAGSTTTVTLPSYQVVASTPVKTISSGTKFDSLTGVAKNITLLSGFTPTGSGVYVLAMDTCSVTSGGTASRALSILRLVAKDNNGKIIGQVNLDSLKASASADLPHQWVIPFNDKLVGTKFDVVLVGTATDSIYVNRAYLYKVQLVNVGNSIFGR